MLRFPILYNHHRAISLAVLLGCLMLISVRHVLAQEIPPDRPPAVGLDQRLNVQVPLDLVFRDEQGQQVQLGDFFGSRPVILTLGYYQCPMLCSLVRHGLLASLQELSFDAGNQFDVVNVSIDPREEPSIAAAQKAMYVQSYRRPGAAGGWHFLTGEETSIRTLAGAVGFRYAYDPQIAQYAHPAGIMVVTPRGRIARYFYGIDYPAQDLRLALVEASENQIGSPTDQFLLLCYHYDPKTGKYSLAILRLTRIIGSASALALGLGVFMLFRRERHKSQPMTGSPILGEGEQR